MEEGVRKKGLGRYRGGEREKAEERGERRQEDSCGSGWKGKEGGRGELQLATSIVYYECNDFSLFTILQRQSNVFNS